MPTFESTTDYSVNRARAYLAGVQAASPPRYLFAADQRPSANTTVPAVDQSWDSRFYAPWQQMVLGKAIAASALGIDNWAYDFGKSWVRYDDSVDLTGQAWYAIVNAGSFSHVFACLDNAGNAASTVQPDFTTATGTDGFSYRASDGYVWMYLCSTDSGTVANLATANLFPLLPNTVVEDAAVPGAVLSVAVDRAGKGYDNYVTGTFQASDVRAGGSPTLYQLSNSQISTANGFYTGCVMTITNGTGVGQFQPVVDYYSSDQGNFVTVAQPFPIPPTNGSQFQLLPGVSVSGDGTETSEPVAVAVINASSSNSVAYVQVLDPGSGLFFDPQASVQANAVVGVELAAQVRPIMPPAGGFGWDQATLLGATTVLLGVTLANTEGGLIPAVNSYREVGIVAGPQFASVAFGLSGTSGEFESGEGAEFLSLRWAANGAQTNAASAVVGCDTRCFSAGDAAYFVAGTEQFLGTVASVTNSSSMALASNAGFTSASANAYLATELAEGTVQSAPSQSNVVVTGVTAPVPEGCTLYGSASMAAGVVTGFVRNGVAKDFGTFVQARKLAVTPLGGAFVQDEVVLQGSATALVHSYANGVLLVTNETAPFRVPGPNLTGNTSGAIAAPTQAWAGELVPGTGTIEYVEQVAQVTRQPSQSEGWIVALGF